MTDIKVVRPDGQVGIISSEDAADAAEQGYRLATDGEVSKARKVAAYEESSAFEKAGTLAGATLAGAARGLSAEFSDPATLLAAEAIAGKKTADNLRNKLNEYKEVAPNASALGEAAGLLGGLALGSGEVGGGLKGLGLVQRGITGAGRAVEGAAARALGAEAATSLGGRVLSRGISSGLGSALEGAIYAEGHAASEAALGDEVLTGEKMAAALEHGGGLGFGIGFGLGGLSGAIGRATEKSGLTAAREASIADAEVAAGNSVRSRISQAAREQANINTFKAMGGTKSEFAKMRRFSDLDYTAEALREGIEQRTGKSIGYHTPESINEYATKELKLTESTKKKLLSSIDKDGVVGPSADALNQAARDEILAPHMRTDVIESAAPKMKLDYELPAEMAANDTAATRTFIDPLAAKSLKPLQKLMGQVEESLGENATFRQWYDARKMIDDAIDRAGAFSAKGNNLSSKYLLEYRRLFEKEFDAAGERAARELGSSFEQQWNATQKFQKALIFAKEATESKANSKILNNSLNLNSVIAAAGAGAFGGPLWGLGAAVVGKVIKDRGDQISADVLSRVAKLTEVQQAVARTDARIASGVSKLFSGVIPTNVQLSPAVTARRVGTYYASEDKRKDFEKTANEIRMAQASPQITAEKLRKAYSPYALEAPKSTAAAMATTARGVWYLHSKLPPTSTDPYSVTPQFEKPNQMVSDAQVNEFMNRVQTFRDPVGVLDLAAKNKATRAHIETMQAIYPKMYEQMKSDATRAATQAKRPLTYQEKIKVGVLYGTPTDVSMTPQFQKAIQGTFLPTHPPQNKVPSGTSLNLAKSTASTMDRVMSK